MKIKFIEFHLKLNSVEKKNFCKTSKREQIKIA